MNKNMNILSRHMGSSGLQMLTQTDPNMTSFLDDKKMDNASLTILNNKMATVDAKVNLVDSELKKKADYKETFELLDEKANIDDVNNALVEIHTELDQRGDPAEEQRLIKMLSFDFEKARWSWRSGYLKGNNTVPWEVETLNTCPHNFVWEKDKTGIIIISSGLYEISFGFFARNKPEVSLVVNNEVVISSIDPGFGNKNRMEYLHSSSNVVGLTCLEFLVLTPRSKIILTYKGEKGAEGFLALKKL